MAEKWVDKKSVLKVGKDIYRAGEMLPAGVLSKSRIKLFESLGQLRVGDKSTLENEDIKKSEKEKSEVDNDSTKK